MAKKTSGTKQTVSKAAEQPAAKPAPAEPKAAMTTTKPSAAAAKPADAKPAAVAEAQEQTSARPADAKATPAAKAQEQTSAKTGGAQPAAPAKSEGGQAQRAQTNGAAARPPVDPRGNKSVTHDQIAQRAFEIYRARGSGHGDPMNDWLQAERELRGR